MPVFDATTLMFLVQPDARPPADPDTGEPLAKIKERMDSLIQDIQAKSETIVIPTPALAEVLIAVPEGRPGECLSRLHQSRHFQIADFDTNAVRKLVDVTRKVHHNKEWKSASPRTKAQLKFDRQIVAVALARNQNTIYSDDNGLKDLAQRFEIKVIPTHALPVAP